MRNPVTPETIRSLLKLGTPADLFAELFVLLNESEFDQAIQELFTEMSRAFSDMATACARELRRQPDMRQIPSQVKGRIASWAGATPKQGLLAAASLISGIDRCFPAVGYFPSGFPQKELRWVSATLRTRGKLNDSAPGRVLPKGSRFDERSLWGFLYNLTYVPESKTSIPIDYGFLRAYAAPRKTMRNPMTVGFVPVAEHLQELRLESSKTSGKTCYSVMPEDSETDAIVRRVREALDLLHARGTTVVMLPELCLNDRIRGEIAKWSLAARRRWDGNDPPLIIAGTQSSPCAGGSVANRAHVIGSDGAVAWTQDKLNPYDIPYKTAQFWGIAEDLGLAIDEIAFESAIAEHPKLVVRDCNFGRLAILICQDFSIDNRIRPLLQYVGPTLLFVPILDSPLVEKGGKVTRWHLIEASHLGAKGMTSVVANSLWVRERQRAKGTTTGARLYAQVLAPPRTVPGRGAHGTCLNVLSDCPQGPYAFWDEGAECV